MCDPHTIAADGPEQLGAVASDVRCAHHPPPTSLPPRSHIDVWLAWVRPPTVRVSWQERSIRDLPAHQPTHADHPTKLGELSMPGAAACMSALLAPSVGRRNSGLVDCGNHIIVEQLEDVTTRLLTRLSEDSNRR